MSYVCITYPDWQVKALALLPQVAGEGTSGLSVCYTVPLVVGQGVGRLFV